MDLLANIPSWDDIERNLDDKFNTLNQAYSDGQQSTYDSWNGFTRRVNTTATQAYGYMGGNRIDYVKAAMRLSYPIIESNLKRKWASIEIEQILPVLLQLVKEVAMILGGSVAVGTVAGGVAGAFFFGVGAVPVAAAGAGIGLQVGNLILMALGLSSIAEYFYKGLPACLSTLQEGFATAWHADEGLKPEGLDPTGGSAYEIQERIDRAARQIAKGQEQLVLLLFTAIVTYMTRGQVKAGIIGSMDSIAVRSAKLQAEISNKQFANWLARNERRLLAEPALRVNEPAPLVKAESETMREYYAKQDPEFVSVEQQIKEFSTFKTMGVKKAEIDAYLATPEGQSYYDALARSSPNASNETLYNRALGQLASGKTLPTAKIVDEPLVKIVVEGGDYPEYSPYFTTRKELMKASESDKTLADFFGLPLESEGLTYGIYEIKPLSSTKVYVSEIAPTSELGGLVERSSEALQYLVPNRGDWDSAVKIGTIGN
ncbi:hypothetical protein NLO85_08970 [Pseudomonas savastanoi]|uniref:NAD(+)--protein-arginine ADP-ribosyltransferase Tre1-like N-terminal domain-containing protein n=1 Tax=Pseudomonas savastanoi TaxID=29438 RepID=A0AAW5IZD6_PSESS|nr:MULTISPECIES: hypothetical protein [Pseudomonas syringae group genomosp. 2]KPW72753.1 Uncharacterized protein ALO78_01148 [Pseudomonas amygdali pv. ciccaronei]KWS39303.1 hypothetical protein AL058_08150 [Pseudomonas savastanoi pv. nerii]KWS63452.1 hypothetical protein AL053_09200 [Pseudomonas savastanoi pv. fraxini]MBA4704279.1 hypothetical protein [Pseudomonas savastanoi pv. savastanoi]MCQ3020699.1 hypothetical protein [Pseudomonas savastanoi]